MYLSLFSGTVSVYQEILLSYLAFQNKICNSSHIDKETACGQYISMKTFGIQDTETLSKWINKAFDALKNAYTPNVLSYNYDTVCEYGYTKKFYIRNVFTYFTSFKWGTNNIMTGSAPTTSDTFITSLQIQTPVVTTTCGGSLTCGVTGSAMDEYPDSNCCNIIRSNGQAIFNRIQTEINEYETKFTQLYITPLNNFANLVKWQGCDPQINWPTYVYVGRTCCYSWWEESCQEECKKTQCENIIGGEWINRDFMNNPYTCCHL
eukprot:129714_1